MKEAISFDKLCPQFGRRHADERFLADTRLIYDYQFMLPVRSCLMTIVAKTIACLDTCNYRPMSSTP